jgi:hypothetical protein
MELTDMELAVRWWSRKRTDEKVEFTHKLGFSEERIYVFLQETILFIWKKINTP